MGSEQFTLLFEADRATSVSLTDIVYVGVLHIEHWRVGLLFLEAGKNVLCEKPFAMNSRQVKELVAAAKKNNVFLMEVESAEKAFSCQIKSNVSSYGNCRKQEVLDKERIRT